MGGHAAGEMASSLAVKTLQKVLSSTLRRDSRHSSDSILEGLKRAFTISNSEIYTMSFKHQQYRGMGTTLTAAIVRSDELYIAHVGDSRAYLIRDNGIDQLTEDHSWVAEQVKSGLLTEEESFSHPWRNVITRALGSRNEVKVDFSVKEIAPDNILVLCSDGLSNLVTAYEISEIATSHKSQKACDILVDLANKRGGIDNITVIVVPFDELNETLYNQANLDDQG
jgi:serine/threonine protein phosphatase PrpC